MTSQELVERAMIEAGAESPADLAHELGLWGEESPRRIRRWLEGKNEPSGEMVIRLLALAGLLHEDVEWEKISVGADVPVRTRREAGADRILVAMTRHQQSLERHMLDQTKLLQEQAKALVKLNRAVRDLEKKSGRDQPRRAKRGNSVQADKIQ